MKKKVTFRTNSFYILRTFLLIIIALLIAVFSDEVSSKTNIYCHRHITNNKLKRFYLVSIL